MSRLRKGLVALGVLGAVAFSPLAWPLSRALAEEPTLEEQMEALQVQAEEQLQRAEQLEAQIAVTSEELRELEEQEAAAASEHQRLRNDLSDTESKIADNQQLLEDTEQRLQTREHVLRRRIRDIYIHGRVSYLDVLFSAKDFNDVMTRMELLSRVLKADLALVNEIRGARETVRVAQQELEQDRAVQAELAARASNKEQELTEKRSKKDAVLASMEDDRESSLAAYEETLAASEEIANLIRQRESGGSEGYEMPTVTGSGQMIWPLHGEITSEYGYRTHPIYGDTRYHSGMDIGGDFGEHIIAAAAGTVIHAGWISGYGYTVIIDHGGGITSLYAHNEELAVGEGQHVSQGQLIAYCGSTGNSTGPHCHFEVREGGEPVSPYDYL